MSKNENLHKASKEKNDEFYTQLSDIEKELKHYKEHFKDKVVFCNCDDPKMSNFYQFFALNFKEYGLKKLITTHFDKEKPTYKLVIDEDNYWDIVHDDKKPEQIPLEQNGDFRSPECIELLKEADIVVTNPPFSLFREYIAKLEEYNKNFIVIGSKNAITYKESFKLIKDNKMWLGTTDPKEFKQPNGEMKKFGNICWFTNLNHKKRNEELVLYKKYTGNETDYPKYDNYDAIEISLVKNIPMDYEGVMGVPITFLDKFNPTQFEILGMSASASYSEDVIGIPFLGEKDARPLLNGKNTYARVFIKNKKIKGE